MIKIELSTGSKFGENYEIKTKLGGGGQANVYKAFDLEMRKEVALKVFHKTEIPRKEIEKEARTQARLHHSHIIPYNWSGYANGHSYISMMFAKHGSLADVLYKHGRPSIDSTIKHTITASEAVQYGHE